MRVMYLYMNQNIVMRINVCDRDNLNVGLNDNYCGKKDFKIL